MIKAVLCDLGDTLINFHNIDIFKAFFQGARETYGYLAGDLNLKVPPFSVYRRSQHWAIRWAYLKSKITGREFNSLDILRHCAQKLNIPIPEEKYDELAWRWYKPLAVQAQADPFAIPLLEELQHRNLKLAIVSNTFVPPCALDRHLQQENLLNYFPLRIYSCEVGMKKPRVEIFDLALQKLNIAPDEALFVGDSYHADIRGARRAGMYAVLKAVWPKKVRIDSSTFIVHSLSQIPQIIDKIETFKKTYT